MVDICLCGIAKEDCDYHKPTVVAVSNSFIYNVSGTVFVPGVTQFTAENLFDAYSGIGEPIEMLVHTALFSRLNQYNLLDFYTEGRVKFQGLLVHRNDDVDGLLLLKSGPVFRTILTFADGRQVVLITREH